MSERVLEQSTALNARHPNGESELIAARKESRGLYWAVGIFSFFANMLMLTGPLYMLQVYDRVLGSRSLETLIALTILVAFLYGIMGLLDYARGRIMGRVAARFQARLERRVFDMRAHAYTTGPAEESGKIQEEDILIKCNNTSLRGIPFFKVKFLICI